MLPAVEEGLEDDAAHAYEKFRSLCTRHGGPGGTLYRYLDENSYITVRSYRYLIGLSDYSARKDLAALVASGRLVKGGSRLFAIYTLPKEEDTGIPQPLVVDSNLPG